MYSEPIFYVLAFGCVIMIAVVLYQILSAQLRQTQYRSKLQHRRLAKVSTSSKKYENSTIYRHIQLMLLSSRMPFRVTQFANVTILLAGIGYLLGQFYFSQLSSIVLCTLMFACLPYVVIRSYLVSKRIEAQREFLPAIEMFYQCYLITGGKQIKLALSKMVDEKQLLTTMQQNFIQLHRNLTIYPDYEYSLSVFNHATGHRWANYFTQMVLIALQEGVTIKGGLKDLIDDMRKVRKSNEAERHRLLEIRIANFTPILFLLVFIGINLYINFENSVEAYLYDETGRKMILYALLLIVLSFAMGIHLSRRKMR